MERLNLAAIAVTLLFLLPLTPSQAIDIPETETIDAGILDFALTHVPIEVQASWFTSHADGEYDASSFEVLSEMEHVVADAALTFSDSGIATVRALVHGDVTTEVTGKLLVSGWYPTEGSSMQYFSKSALEDGVDSRAYLGDAPSNWADAGLPLEEPTDWIPHGEHEVIVMGDLMPLVLPLDPPVEFMSLFGPTTFHSMDWYGDGAIFLGSMDEAFLPMAGLGPATGPFTAYWLPPTESTPAVVTMEKMPLEGLGVGTAQIQLESGKVTFLYESGIVPRGIEWGIHGTGDHIAGGFLDLAGVEVQYHVQSSDEAGEEGEPALPGGPGPMAFMHMPPFEKYTNLPAYEVPLLAGGEVVQMVPTISGDGDLYADLSGLELEPGVYQIKHLMETYSIGVSDLAWDAFVAEGLEDQPLQISQEDILDALEGEDRHTMVWYEPGPVVPICEMFCSKKKVALPECDCDMSPVPITEEGLTIALPENFAGPGRAGTLVARDQFGTFRTPLEFLIAGEDDPVIVLGEPIVSAEDEQIYLELSDVLIDPEYQPGLPMPNRIMEYAFYLGEEGGEPMLDGSILLAPQEDFFNADADCNMLEEPASLDIPLFHLETGDIWEVSLPHVVCSVQDGAPQIDAFAWLVNGEPYEEGMVIETGDILEFEMETSDANEYEFVQVASIEANLGLSLAMVQVCITIDNCMPMPGPILTPCDQVTLPDGPMESRVVVAAGANAWMPVIIDNDGALVCDEAKTLNFVAMPSIPTVTVQAPTTVFEGEPIDIDVHVAGGTGSPNVLIAGVPEMPTPIGSYEITITVTDVADSVEDLNFEQVEEITIEVVARPPAISSPIPDGATVLSDEPYPIDVSHLKPGDVIDVFFGKQKIDSLLVADQLTAEVLFFPGDWVDTGSHTVEAEVTREDETVTFEQNLRVKFRQTATSDLDGDEANVDLKRVKLKVKGTDGVMEASASVATMSEATHQFSKKKGLLQVDAETSAEGFASVILTVQYNDADLQEAGIEEDSLVFYYLYEDGPVMEWIELESPTGTYPYDILRSGQVVQTVYSAPVQDMEANTLSVELAHLSTYQVAGDEAAAAAPRGGGSSKKAPVVEEPVIEAPVIEDPVVPVEPVQPADPVDEIVSHSEDPDTTDHNAAHAENNALMSYVAWFALAGAIVIGIMFILRRQDGE